MDMPEPRLTRYDVTFTVSAPIEGRPLIALSLSQDGIPVAEQSPIFFLEPTDEVRPEDAALMARFLSKYIAHFSVMVPTEAAEPEEP
jgi:hypothetical protein